MEEEWNRETDGLGDAPTVTNRTGAATIERQVDGRTEEYTTGEAVG